MNDNHAVTWYSTWKSFRPLSQSQEIVMELRARSIQLTGSNDIENDNESNDNESNLEKTAKKKSFLKMICSIM